MDRYTVDRSAAFDQSVDAENEAEADTAPESGDVPGAFAIRYSVDFTNATILTDPDAEPLADAVLRAIRNALASEAFAIDAYRALHYAVARELAQANTWKKPTA